MRITSLLALALVSAAATSAGAQVTVSPTGVNTNGQGATTVFLTFAGLAPDQVAVEAFWCGELVSAAPDVGQKCDPATLFGSLPLRFDRARRGGGSLTDIMTIPPSVARRAWQAAAAGAVADFFYVRRFTSTSGGPDVFVSVICRLTSGGAGAPLALTDVRLAFDDERPLVVVEEGSEPPALHADITYTGTGRLQGRWEIVLPGEEPPAERDLLTEATLPLDERGGRRHWAELERFNVFLPPTGRVRLTGPPPSRLPRDVNGAYTILLRIEASDDADSRSSLSGTVAGQPFVASGAVAGFPMPVLRYLVGSGTDIDAARSGRALVLLSPAADDTLRATPAATFAWQPVPGARWYRLELADSTGATVFEALVDGTTAAYRPPPFLAERISPSARWRVRALDTSNRETARSAWRKVRLQI